MRSHKKLKHKDVVAAEIKAKDEKDTQSVASMMLSVSGVGATETALPQQDLKPGTIGEKGD